MPLNTKAVENRVASGRPFIVGTYTNANVDTMMCKSKANASVKVERVIRKHLIMTPAGAHVYTEWFPEGMAKDQIPAANPALKPGVEVCVDLQKYARDGVGYDIMGTIEVISPAK